MAQIKDKKQYDAIMARIDELFFATYENTPKDDRRLLELDVLSAMVKNMNRSIILFRYLHFAVGLTARSLGYMPDVHQRRFGQSVSIADVSALTVGSAP